MSVVHNKFSRVVLYRGKTANDLIGVPEKLKSFQSKKNSLSKARLGSTQDYIEANR